MLNEIITNIIEENRNAYRAHRAKVEERACELNAGWVKTRYGREGFDKVVAPTWGKDDRPHAPFDGYLWENELGEVEAYHAGSYLPYTTELEQMDKPEYTGDHGWWKLRLTFDMYLELKAFEYIEMKKPYKLWDLGKTRVGMVEVRAHKTILKAIQEFSQKWFDDYYTTLNADKGEAPMGKLTVKGRVVSVKDWMGDYGPVFKMTVRLENGSTVYGSLPKAVPADYRGEIEFKATFEHAKDDSTHSFFKRPSSVTIEE
ncbi:hypothetical protein FDI23_gp088 [Serratia phage CHI14]|uniref:Uncharacterized protein n=2 Tax=Winklervirus chi14 TaxID=2560752 RepID=A0A1Z1LY86_9CAUD|nr:hypothetical protein FDI23_gp088 [Serratia phage CHI14]ARW57511.1 hypothetical protein [Serratia phage CHI14]ARW57786.1 hypothetical protein [Serratia phage CBH8]